MTRKVGYCDACNNTGEIDCHCGGDLCVCGQNVEPCPACDGGDAILGEYDDEDEDDDCPTCSGRGTVNPLTPNLPEDFLCLGTETCPRCDGSGHFY